MAAEAWVVEDSHYNKDPDGEFDEHSNHLEWVFPEGLTAGRPVQYFERRRTAGGFPRYGCVDSSQRELLAEGSIDRVAGEVVTFTWARAVTKKDDAPWQTGGSPANRLTMKEVQHCEMQRRSSETRRAQRRTGFRISAPEAAWKLLRPRPSVFVATLSACETGPDGHLILTLTTMSGEDVSLSAAPGSTIAVVAAMLCEERGLDAVDVRLVTAGGTQLAPESSVQAAML